MRTLRGGNSNLQMEKSKSKSKLVKDLKDSVDDDIGANGDETTDDEGGVDTPPPPPEEDDDSKGEEKLENGKVNKEESAKNDETEYEVEQIVDMQVQKRKKCPVQFRIRWLGFTEKDDTWVPSSELNCQELVEDFLEISGRKSEYEKAFESRKRVADSSAEGFRQSSRKITRITYSELDEDQDEILPSGTRTRKVKTKAEKKQMPNFSSSSSSLKKKRRLEKSSVASKRPKKEEQFEVEKILDHRVRGRFSDYKIRWKNYSPHHDSWLSESELNCANLIKSYSKRVHASTVKEELFEVEAIAGMRETKGRVEYKVRWKNWGPKYDSWLPEEELRCPEILNKFKKTLDKLEKQEDWQVEKIISSREHRGKVEFLIRWKGFDSKCDTWEPRQNLEGCQSLVDKFLEQEEKKNVTKSGEKVAKAGEKVAKAGEKADKSEEEVDKSDKKVAKSDRKVAKSEKKSRSDRLTSDGIVQNDEESSRPRSKRRSNVTTYSEDN